MIKEDIEFVFGDKKLSLKLSEHLKASDPNGLVQALSRYYFYRDHFVNEYWVIRLEYKQTFSTLDYEKRTNLKNLEKQSVDSRGRSGFKVTEQMIKDEVHTDPRYVQLKIKEREIKFLINRLESGIELLSWKLQILCGSKPKLNTKQIPEGTNPISEKYEEQSA